MIRQSTVRLAFGLALVLIVFVPASAQTYQGADFCSNCHMDIYNKWKVSGHPYKLTPAAEAKNRPIPLPEGYTWDDISYVIGGYKWKSRYMGTDGYIITSVDTDGNGTPDTDGRNQYNMLTGQWSDYHPGELKPYDCGRCHTTGFSATGNQGGLPGIAGTWAFGGVQCEECHGPGFGPHSNPATHIDNSAAACGACHIRGDQNTIPASGGFIRHHEQYNEMLASPHFFMDCTSCHDPHMRAEFSITLTCQDCHPSIASSYAGTPMDAQGVDCIDCHMPFATKSAQALGPYRGDVRTHLFRINRDADQRMFTADGGFVLLDGMGQGAVNLDFACKSCHTDKSTKWALSRSQNFHSTMGPLRVERSFARKDE